VRNPYDVLGVGRDASAREVASAYRKKAILHHPDRNPGDVAAQAAFMEATSAYEILSDAEKRLAFDLADAESKRARQNVRFNININADDFEGAFGFQNRNPVNRARHAGKDVEHEVALTVEESVLGATKVLSFEDGEEVSCTRCSGTRAEPGTRRMPCTHCAGSGKSFFGSFEGGSRQTCSQCAGRGDIPIKKCSECAGSGSKRLAREFSVKIPAGISDGQRLRLAGKGEPGNGGPPGDMFVTVRVREGGRFSRRGNDLYLTARVPFRVAMGHLVSPRSAFQVTGVDGREHKIDLSKGFKPGETQFVVRGAGVGGMSGERGNLHVILHVDLPEVKTARAEALMREIVDELTLPGERWVSLSPDD
jgi:molecular chaperone DnaJ